MSHLLFWQDILFATQVLHYSTVNEPVRSYRDEIVQFLQQEMDWNLRVISWANPMRYIMNDVADPLEDLPKLFDFINSKLPPWQNNDLIRGYLMYLNLLLYRYVKERSSSGR